MSCVWEVRQTPVLLCVLEMYVPLLYALPCSCSSGSANSSGCVVNGCSAMAAS